MGPGVFALIKRVRSERGIQAALGLKDTLAIALVRQIAPRTRTGWGKPDDWVTRSTAAPPADGLEHSHSKLPTPAAPSLPVGPIFIRFSKDFLGIF